MNPAFFEKNKIDLDDSDVSIAVTDGVAEDTGEDSVDYMRNRDNSSGWATTGSTDAAGTYLIIDCGTEYEISDIFFLVHNMKAFEFEYYDGAAYTSFTPAINETANTETSNYFHVTTVTARYFKLTIDATMVADADKYISQIILTKRIGQLKTGFKISGVQRDQGRKRHKMLSGKSWISRTTSAWEYTFEKENVIIQSDIDLIEELYEHYYGFLVWLCGGDDTIFKATAIGWRKQDLMLMQFTSEYTPSWNDGRYHHGLDLSLTMVESI